MKRSIMRQSAAFTLAEILITLAIIGIVAAITIPITLSNIEKHKTINILKRAYSDLFAYVKDFDYINDCNGSFSNCASEESGFINKFSEYLINKQNFTKITKNTYTPTCITFNGESKFNCLVHATSKYFLKSPSGYAYGVGANLNDIGRYSIFRGTYPKNYTRDDFRAMIWIYTAPNKFENKKSRLGYDMFSAFVMQSEDIVPNGSAVCGNGAPPYGWTYFCGAWQNSCNPETSTTPSAYGCLSRIIEDGWQINYR